MKFRNYDNYEVFDDGRIWSYKTKRFLKPGKKHNGYQVVVLYDNEGKPKTYLVHRIVYEAVSGEPIPEGYYINHIDERKDNNARSNLELLTHKENCNYGTRNKRMAKSKSKQVGAFKNGELIMTFQSVNEAHRQGFNKGSVAACCRNCFNRLGNNVYKGFVWKYI